VKRRTFDVIRVMLLLAGVVAGLASSAGASEAPWDLLRGGGQVVLLRHTTTTPGAGDPPGFRLDACATQRNLTDPGRDEARRIGAAFRARGIPVGAVLSSPWCRCLETARLAFGRAEPWPALSNLFGDRSREAEQVAAMRARVSQRPAEGNLVLVTHGVTIQALTGQSVAQGEFLVVTPEGDGRFRVAGRVPPSALD
jgi:phosphohistidine phosphatase SixA